MGADSGIKSHHKRRTHPHKKHEAFPGMRVSSNINIVSGSIKPVRVTPKARVIDLRALV